MPELNLPCPSTDPGLSPAVPAAPGLVPATLGGRALPAGIPLGFAAARVRAAFDVPASDVHAFDTALAAAEPPDSGALVPAATTPSGTSGSMAEMTAILSVYRDANAMADTAERTVSGAAGVSGDDGAANAVPGLQAARAPDAGVPMTVDVSDASGAVATVAANRSPSAPMVGDATRMPRLASGDPPLTPGSSAAKTAASGVDRDAGAPGIGVEKIVGERAGEAVASAASDPARPLVEGTPDVRVRMTTVASDTSAADAMFSAQRSSSLSTDIDGTEMLRLAFAQPPLTSPGSRSGMTMVPGMVRDADTTARGTERSVGGFADEAIAGARSAPARPLAERTPYADAQVTAGPSDVTAAALPAVAKRSPSMKMEAGDLALPGAEQGARVVIDVALPAAPLGAVAPPVSPIAPLATVSSLPEAPSASRWEVATIVRQVIRVLGMRDLEALDAGREVVLRLDENILPQTQLSFRLAKADAASPAYGGAPEVQLSLETQSDEVRAFLDTHGQSLIDAMAIEAPALRWLPGVLGTGHGASLPVMRESAMPPSGAALLDSALAPAAVLANLHNQGTASRDDERGTSSQDSRGSPGQPGRGSTSDSGGGQHQGESPQGNPATNDDAGVGVEALARWNALSRAQAGEAYAFTDAVGAQD